MYMNLSDYSNMQRMGTIDDIVPLGEASTEAIHLLCLFILYWLPAISLIFWLAFLESWKGSSTGSTKKIFWLSSGQHLE
jgi:hypothetical protein